MNCYQHNDSTAIGTCKACNKAVCLSCAIDTGNGLACSEQCKTEVLEINQVVEKSKNIYGIGKNAPKNLIPSGVLVYIFFTVIFLGWAVFEYVINSRTNTYFIVMGLAFMGMGIFAYRRAKQMSLNC